MTENWYKTWGQVDFQGLTASNIFHYFWDKKWDANACDEHDISVLQHLLRVPAVNVEAVYVAVRFGADLNWADETKVRPLHDLSAVLNRDKRRALTPFFLANNANPNVSDVDGRTPLHSMVFAEDEHCVGLLRAAGADLNAQDCMGESAIFKTVYNNGCTVAQTLLDLGASITIYNKCGQTPLTKETFSAIDGSSNKIQHLIGRGYRLHPKNMKPKPPVVIMRKTNKILRELSKQKEE